MSANPNSITVEAGKIERQYFADSWRYRELFAFLAWRDILVRYKQTAIGVAWAVLQPFLIMVVFSAVFGKLAKFPSEGGAPYPIMVYAGMLPWQFFANCFRESASSLVANRNMVSKVYFPRLVLPFSSVAVSFVDFLISLVILAGLMVWYRFVPTWRIVYLPLFIVIAVIASFGPGLFIAALNVKYRDFKYVVPFIIQFGLYISPVGFSARVIPEKFRLLYSLNPMVGVIDGFRWAILGGESTIYLQGFLLSISIVVAVCVLGFWYFRKTEKSFADVIWSSKPMSDIAIRTMEWWSVALPALSPVEVSRSKCNGEMSGRKCLTWCIFVTPVLQHSIIPK